MAKHVSPPRAERRALSDRPGLDARAALRRTPLAAAVSALVASTVAPPLMAQEEGLEVIVVTATRREQSIQDIPINIAAFDGELLEEREISDLAELGRNVPGLFVVDQGKRGSNRIVVRGLNVDSITSSESLGNDAGGVVSTYIGEIPLYVDLSLTDIDRVEVLLGPQGTLYGAGTLGGAVRYIPRRPEFDATTLSFRGGSFDLAHGDDFGFRGGLTGNFPVGESLALRATLDYYDDPGFIDTPFLVRESGVSDAEPDFGDPADVAANLRTEEDANWEETLAARVGLRWQPADNIDANLTYYHQDVEVGGRTQNHALAFGTEQYTSATRYPEPFERENRLFAAEIIADLGFAELTSATGFAQYEEVGQRDQTDLLITLEFSYEAYPAFSAFTRDTQDDETWSQELRLVSTGDGPWSWIGGLFYRDQEADGTSSEFTPHYDEYLFQFFGVSLRPDSLEYYSVLFEDLEEKALFGEVGYQFTDKLQVAVGGRFYDYTYETESGATVPLILTALPPEFGGGLPPDELGLTTERNSQDDDGFLYKVNASYRFTDDVMGYATISEGYRIGSANGVAPCPDPLPPGQIVCAYPDEFQYFPDSTTNYEIGVHSQWLDRRLTFNAALFYIDWQDPQLTSATINGAQPITKNGAGAESTGLELSFQAQVTDRLDLAFSYSHTEAELSDAAPDLLRVIVPPGFGPSGTSALFVDGLTGDRLPGAPEDQGTFNVSYEFPLNGQWGLDLNYGLAAVGDVLTKTGTRAGGEVLGGFTVHSASAVLSGGPWTIALYAQNLTDKFAVTGVRGSRPYLQTVADENGEPVRLRYYGNEVLRPREVGLRFTYDLEL